MCCSLSLFQLKHNTEHVYSSLTHLSMIDRMSSPPLIVFGHSLGAILAYELARRLASSSPRVLRVSHLIISASNNPSIVTAIAKANTGSRLPPGTRKYHTLSDDALIEVIVSMGNAREGVDTSFLRSVLPLLKADFTALETYDIRAAENRMVLDCPISLFGGGVDPDVCVDSLEGWRLATTASVSLQVNDCGDWCVYVCMCVCACATATPCDDACAVIMCVSDLPTARSSVPNRPRGQAHDAGAHQERHPGRHHVRLKYCQWQWRQRVR